MGLKSAVAFDFESAGFTSTDWTRAAGAATSGGADGGVALVMVGSLAPPNDNIASFDTPAPAAKQMMAPPSITAALSSPRLPPRAGGGAFSGPFILERGEAAPPSATADEPSRFQ